ncbi:unnamed protein product [Brassica rapa subsp. narinosa]|uniref:(rape) hypothetical protein n=1 Tax=Brassica napus TaxID=3708 RepID=A0A816P8Q6_BRANA|nr:unnamed protein product [Brassica napus]
MVCWVSPAVVFKLDSSDLNIEMEVRGCVSVPVFHRSDGWCLGLEERWGVDVACGCDSFSRRGSSMAISEEGRMALHCGHMELRQRQEGSPKRCCFSGSQKQNMRRFKLHRLVNEGVWVLVVSCFKV